MHFVVYDAVSNMEKMQHQHLSRNVFFKLASLLSGWKFNGAKSKVHLQTSSIWRDGPMMRTPTCFLINHRTTKNLFLLMLNNTSDLKYPLKMITNKEFQATKEMVLNSTHFVHGDISLYSSRWRHPNPASPTHQPPPPAGLVLDRPVAISPSRL